MNEKTNVMATGLSNVPLLIESVDFCVIAWSVFHARTVPYYDSYTLSETDSDPDSDSDPSMCEHVCTVHQ